MRKCGADQSSAADHWSARCQYRISVFLYLQHRRIGYIGLTRDTFQAKSIHIDFFFFTWTNSAGLCTAVKSMGGSYIILIESHATGWSSYSFLHLWWEEGSENYYQHNYCHRQHKQCFLHTQRQNKLSMQGIPRKEKALRQNSSTWIYAKYAYSLSIFILTG